MPDRSIFSKQRITSFFDNISKIALGGVLFFCPLFFFPFFELAPAEAKLILVTVLVLIAAIAYLTARVSEGIVILPKALAFILVLSLPIIFFLSALSTDNFKNSFLGSGANTTTGLFILIISIITILSSVYFRFKENILKSLQLVVLSYTIVGLYQCFRLVSALLTQNPNDTMLSFGVFVGPYSNLIGKWNDVAIFSGIFPLVTIVLWKSLSKNNKYLLTIISVLAIFLISVVSLYILLPIVALLLTVYLVQDFFQKGIPNLDLTKTNTIFRGVVLAIVLILVSTTLISRYAVTQNSVGQIMHPRVYNFVYAVPNLFGGIPAEVRPGIDSTYRVLVETFKNNPIFGQGPGRFNESWALYKPIEINKTQYGDVDFIYGFGYIPTLMVTTGIAGSFVLLFFFIYIVKQCGVIIFSKKSTSIEKAVSYSTVYLILFSSIYVPAYTLVVYMFFGIGFILARTGREGVILRNNKINRIIIKATLLLFIVLTGTIIYSLTKEYVALKDYRLSLKAINTDKDISLAESYITKALARNPIDLYYRTSSEISFLKANVILTQNTKDGIVSQDARESALKNYTQAKEYADKAIVSNPDNYLNYVFAARMYESDQNELKKAEDLYMQSLKYNPNNPNIYFGIAKVRARKGDIEGAKINLQKAIQIRPTHIESLLAAAEIKAREKDFQGTIELLAQAYKSDTSRVNILLAIADIQYSQLNDITSAIETVEFAINSNSQYQEAKLALSKLYSKQQRFSEAIKLLNTIPPANDDTKKILEEYIKTLELGKDPFVAKDITDIQTEAKPKNR